MAEISNSYCDERVVMVTLPTYHICLICATIESLHQGGLPPQGADKAYVILLQEATYVSKNVFFDLHNAPCAVGFQF